MTRLLIISFILFFACTSPAQAAINDQITFFGELQNTGGTPVTGTYDMVFRFYDASVGGTLLDTSTHTAGNGNPVTVTQGEFSVMLGSGAGNTLDGIDFNSDTIYVGLTVGADSEMTPRERLTAAAYSFNADRLDGYDSSDFLKANATNTVSTTSVDTLFSFTQGGTGDILNLFDGATEVFTVTDGGRVGIGTSTPTRTLTVAGDMQLTGALYDSTNSAGTAGYVLQSTGSGVQWVATSTLGVSGGTGLFTDGGATTYLTELADNVVIGSTALSGNVTAAVANEPLPYTNEVGGRGFAFNDTGTVLYTSGLYPPSPYELDIRAYQLATPFDVGTVMVSDIARIDTTAFASRDAYDLQFNADGTKLYQYGYFLRAFFAYNLSTPYDLNTVTYSGEKFEPPSSALEYSFNVTPDGQTLYYINDATLVETYELTIPGDLSSAVSSSTVLDFAPLADAPMDLKFNDDGTKFYLLDASTNTIVEYDLSSPYVITTASSTTVFSIAAQTTFPQNMSFNGDGSQVIVLDGANFHLYNLGTAYDMSTASFVRTISRRINTGNVTGADFNSTGSILYTINNSNDSVTQYALSTAFDTSTAVAQLGNVFSVANQETNPTGVTFNPAGTVMYIVGYTSDAVHEYSLSSAFDLTTASYTGISFSVLSETTAASDIRFNPTGTKMYISDQGADVVIEYTLSTPFDITTAATSSSFSVSAQETQLNAFDFSSDGATLYAAGNASDKIHVYALSIPYDVSTASFSASTAWLGNMVLQALVVAADDTKVTLIDTYLEDDIRTYQLTLFTDKLTVSGGNINFAGDYKLMFDGQLAFTASTTNTSTQFGIRAGEFLHPDAQDNLLIGYEAGRYASSSNHDENTFIGYQTGAQIVSSVATGTTAIGYQTGFALNGIGNTLLGTQAGYSVVGDYNTALGYQAASAASGDMNTVTGYQAGQHLTGDQNTLFGTLTGQYATGTANTYVGTGAGQYAFGDYNLYLGREAGATSTGNDNVFIGAEAGVFSEGDSNVFIGGEAGQQNIGSLNVFIGSSTAKFLRATTSVLIGADSFRGTAAFDAVNNVAIGYRTGFSAQTGASNNILIGYRAADNLTTGSNNIVIGYDVDVQDATQSNTLNIGNFIFGTGLTATGTTVSTGYIGIGTSSPTHQLTTTGGVRFSSLGAGTVIADANGVLSVSSDERLKNIQSMYTNGIDSLITIEPIIYKWNDVSGLDTVNDYIGFSAQNIQTAIPGAVGEDNRGYLTLSDRGILATVVNSVKEVWNTLENIFDRSRALDVRIKELQKASILLDTELAKHDVDTTSPDTRTTGDTASATTTEVTPSATSTATTTSTTGSTTPAVVSNTPDTPEETFASSTSQVETQTEASTDEEETPPEEMSELSAEDPGIPVENEPEVIMSIPAAEIITESSNETSI